MSASVAGWIAIGAALVAVAALAFAVLFQRRPAALHSGERSLLGSDGPNRDLVEFTVSLQSRLDGFHRRLDDLAAELSQVDRRVAETIGHLGVVRYDAYENTGGHQSASIAFLDGSRTGVVLSAIQGRDYARIYVKELEEGRAAVNLSPEEQEAVNRAMRPH